MLPGSPGAGRTTRRCYDLENDWLRPSRAHWSSWNPDGRHGEGNQGWHGRPRTAACPRHIVGVSWWPTGKPHLKRRLRRLAAESATHGSCQRRWSGPPQHETTAFTTPLNQQTSIPGSNPGAAFLPATFDRICQTDHGEGQRVAGPPPPASRHRQAEGRGLSLVDRPLRIDRLIGIGCGLWRWLALDRARRPFRVSRHLRTVPNSRRPDCTSPASNGLGRHHRSPCLRGRPRQVSLPRHIHQRGAWCLDLRRPPRRRVRLAALRAGRSVQRPALQRALRDQ